MENLKTLGIAIGGEMLIASTATDNVAIWVSCICSAIIAFATCALQVYKMFKNRDKIETFVEIEQGKATGSNENVMQNDEKEGKN